MLLFRCFSYPKDHDCSVQILLDFKKLSLGHRPARWPGRAGAVVVGGLSVKRGKRKRIPKCKQWVDRV